jgi:hypothetical protein
MRLNVFEGARRIALVLGLVWVTACVAYGVFTEPYTHLFYSANGPGAAFVKADRCGDDDGSRYVSTTDAPGNRIAVTLCFKAFAAEGGERLVPYAPADNGRWWMAGKYSSEVKRYMDEREAAFSLNPQGNEEAKRLRWEGRLELWKYAALAAVGGVTIGWLLVAVTGWVVRGFLGIPRGRDSRPLE